MSKQNYDVIEAANKKFNDFIDSVSELYGRQLTGYGEFDRDILEMPNQLKNHDDEIVNYSSWFIK